MAELSKGGTGSPATIASALTRPSASSTRTDSAGRGSFSCWTAATASSIETSEGLSTLALHALGDWSDVQTGHESGDPGGRQGEQARRQQGDGRALRAAPDQLP